MFKRTRFQYGSFRRKGDRWELRFYQDGRRKHVLVGTLAEFPSKSAIKKSAQVQALLLGANAEHPTASSGLTMGTLISRYEMEEMPERYATQTGYKSYLRQHIKPRWESTLLCDVRPLAVEAWLNGLELAPKTRGHIKQLLHVLFKCALRWGVARTNPIDLVRIKGGTQRLEQPRVLTPEEFMRLVACLKEPFGTMVTVAGCLGLRVSEIVGLRWSDFDFNTGTLLVQRGIVEGRVGPVKTEASRNHLPLDPALVRVLMQHREHCYPTAEGWLFANPETSQPFHQGPIQQKHMKSAAIAAGIAGRVGWHTFRHSYRSWMDQGGASLSVQRELMRHASISTTVNTYGRAMSADKRQANGNVVTMVLKTPKPMVQAAIGG